MRSGAKVIADWRHSGLIVTSKEEGDEIYDRYINSTNCEKCGNEYKSTRDRHMDHSHDIHEKWGFFRNVLCQSCNLRRCKLHKYNTSGCSGIYKMINKKYKQGYIWNFQVHLNGKLKSIKQSVDLEYLKDYAENWKFENKYSN